MKNVPVSAKDKNKLQYLSKYFGNTLTDIIVSSDGYCSSCTRALLSEVITNFYDAGVVLQHGCNLHLKWVTQFLSLWEHMNNFIFSFRHMPSIVSSRSAIVSYLVVDLNLSQSGVFSQCLDDGHHALCSNEVGLNVEALQGSVGL